MFRRKTQSVAPDQALPGRDRPIEVSGVHFVNGDSYLPPYPDEAEVAYFGMGCFWGAERIFWQIPGVITTAVGYQGGYTPNPTYEEACTGRTGHAEVALVVYDPDKVSFEEILKQFWEQHDPTTLNRQGNDVGTQYRSAIYTTTEGQLKSAVASRDAYQDRLTEQGFGEITSEITEAPEFFFAEEYHQQYLAKNPNGYCNHGFCQISYETATSDS